MQRRPDDWSPVTLSDVRQERFEQVAPKRHGPAIVVERVDLCEHGALKVGSDRRALQVGRDHDLSTIPDELGFVRPDGHQTMVGRARGRRSRDRYAAGASRGSQPAWPG
jgi:hypothetical protein